MIDTHAHLNDEKFAGNVAKIVENAKNAGVREIVCVGSDLETSKQVVLLAQEFENIFAVIGFHPHDAKSFSLEAEQELIELAKHKKVVAIGEIGLDFHYDFSPREIQQEVFEKQIELACKLNLPIVIHTREADEQTFATLLKHKEKIKGGIIHCFSSNAFYAKKYVELGFLLGVGGSITFKNADELREAIKEVGLNNIVLETDCPYLAPVPFRGKTNEPKYLPLVVKTLGELLGETEENIIKITTQNAKRVYGIWKIWMIKTIFNLKRSLVKIF